MAHSSGSFQWLIPVAHSFGGRLSEILRMDVFTGGMSGLKFRIRQNVFERVNYASTHYILRIIWLY